MKRLAAKRAMMIEVSLGLECCFPFSILCLDGGKGGRNGDWVAGSCVFVGWFANARVCVCGVQKMIQPIGRPPEVQD